MNDQAAGRLGTAVPAMTESHDADTRPPNPEPRTIRSRLYYKYVGLVVTLVLAALLSNGLMEAWATFQAHKASLIRVQHEQAEAAAAKITQFIAEIESQLGWTTQLPWSIGTLEQRRFDAQRLLRQVPAITELTQMDASGKEQLRVSRLAIDVIGSGLDRSSEPQFAEAVENKVYYGPVYFRLGSEPYMTLALAGNRRDAGVSAAEVNLKFIWDVISQIRVGERGRAYVIGRQGRLIAHPDISLVLRQTDMSHLSQVKAARKAAPSTANEQAQEALDLQGHRVLTSYASVAPLSWIVFVELPLSEAYAPLYNAIRRSLLILLGALCLALLAGMVVARRMVVPIRALHAGAQRIGGGDLSQQISIKTGDELEDLADQFNDMASRLAESQRDLEKKVETRTRELSESLEQQTATADILRAISGSPTDAQPVFDMIARSSALLCGAEFCHVFRFDGELVHFVAYNYDDGQPGGSEAAEAARRAFPAAPDLGSAAGRLLRTREIVNIPDVLDDAGYSLGTIAQLLGYRSIAGVPMLREGEPAGAIAVMRRQVGRFSERQVELLRTFADQAVIAIENVRLFTELEARNVELARSVEELRALGEVSQAVNSTLDVETVLSTIVAKAVQLSGTDAGSIYVFDTDRAEFHLRANHGMDPAVIEAIQGHRVRLGDTAVGIAAAERRPLQIADVSQAPESHVIEVVVRAGYRAFLVVPLLGPNTVVGALIVRRKAPGSFRDRTVDLLQTFATQSVLAIQNARLFREIAEKSRELEIASRHKSQFLANMSHELRTPLNAILGYTELILDSIYGEPPEKMRAVLERVQSNGHHLLGLINDVLDISKIEAGQLELSLADYSMADVLQSVHSAVASLAEEKKLNFRVDAPPNLPVGHGDERRITQVLLNLTGNGIKFTEAGEVAIEASASNGMFRVSVRDTGAGIAPEDHARIFDEFQQADNTSTRNKGGSGLGLAISKRIIEMHGGNIWVESELAQGSTFTISLPIKAEQQAASP